MAGAGSEQAFLNFYRPLAAKWGLSADPDAPEHHYDYRAAWRAGATPDATGHWPSQFKDAGHPRRFMATADGRIVDTITGADAPRGTAAGFTESGGMKDTLGTSKKKRTSSDMVRLKNDLSRLRSENEQPRSRPATPQPMPSGRQMSDVEPEMMPLDTSLHEPFPAQPMFEMPPPPQEQYGLLGPGGRAQAQSALQSLLQPQQAQRPNMFQDLSRAFLAGGATSGFAPYVRGHEIAQQAQQRQDVLGGQAAAAERQRMGDLSGLMGQDIAAQKAQHGMEPEPMVEINGQQYPLSVAMEIAEAQGKAMIQDPYKDRQLAESERANRAGEGIDERRLGATTAENQAQAANWQAQRAEAERHNKAMEGIGGQRAETYQQYIERPGAQGRTTPTPTDVRMLAAQLAKQTGNARAKIEDFIPQAMQLLEQMMAEQAQSQALGVSGTFPEDNVLNEVLGYTK